MTQEFLLQYGTDGSIKVSVENKGAQVEVKVGSEVFTFTDVEVQQATAQGLRSHGQWCVTSPAIQRCFDCRPIAKGAKTDGAAAANQLAALFPGKVVKILAQEKKSYEAGDLLVVMESMKMEYAYKAPKRLTVEKVLVKEGQVVGKGEEFFQWQTL